MDAHPCKRRKLSLEAAEIISSLTIDEEAETTCIDPNGDVVLVTKSTSPPTRLLVSSTTLKTASPVFAVLLDGHFVEANAFKKAGSVQIHLDDTDDAKALTILMTTIHERTWDGSCPRDLQTMFQVAVLVDKYLLVMNRLPGDMLEYFRGPYPGNHGESLAQDEREAELVMKICIAWIFDAAERFNESTLLAVRTGRALDFTGLPVPNAVADQYNAIRCAAMSKMCRLVRDLRGFYNQHKRKICCQICDLETRRGLKRLLREWGMLYSSKLPEKTLRRYSLLEIERKIEMFQTCRACRDGKRGDGRKRTTAGNCESIRELMRKKRLVYDKVQVPDLHYWKGKVYLYGVGN